MEDMIKNSVNEAMETIETGDTKKTVGVCIGGAVAAVGLGYLAKRFLAKRKSGKVDEPADDENVVEVDFKEVKKEKK